MNSSKRSFGSLWARPAWIICEDGSSSVSWMSFQFLRCTKKLSNWVVRADNQLTLKYSCYDQVFKQVYRNFRFFFLFLPFSFFFFFLVGTLGNTFFTYSAVRESIRTFFCTCCNETLWHVVNEITLTLWRDTTIVIILINFVTNLKISTYQWDLYIFNVYRVLNIAVEFLPHIRVS